MTGHLRLANETPFEGDPHLGVDMRKDMRTKVLLPCATVNVYITLLSSNIMSQLETTCLIIDSSRPGEGMIVPD